MEEIEPASDYSHFSDVFLNPYARNFYYACIIVIAIVSTAVNIFIIQAILRKRQLRTPINIFLLNVAVLDIYVIYGILFYDVFALFVSKVILKTYSCKTVHFQVSIGQFALMLFLSSITAALFVKKIRMKTTVVISVAIYIVATASSFSYSQLFENVTLSNNNVYCARHFNDKFDKFLFQFYETISQSLLIFVLLLSLQVHKKVRGSFLHRSDTNEMLLRMIAIELILESPVLIAHYLLVFFNWYSNYDLIYYTPGFILNFAFVYRPFLYVYYDKDFKNEFRNLLQLTSSVVEFQGLENDGAL